MSQLAWVMLKFVAWCVYFTVQVIWWVGCLLVAFIIWVTPYVLAGIIVLSILIGRGIKWGVQKYLAHRAQEESHRETSIAHRGQKEGRHEQDNAQGERQARPRKRTAIQAP